MYFIPLLMSETCTLVRFRFVLYSIDVIIVLDCTLLLAPTFGHMSKQSSEMFHKQSQENFYHKTCMSMSCRSYTHFFIGKAHRLSSSDVFFLRIRFLRLFPFPTSTFDDSGFSLDIRASKSSDLNLL